MSEGRACDVARRHGLHLVAGINQVLRDRRIDVYDEMLGAKVNRSWY